MNSRYRHTPSIRNLIIPVLAIISLAGCGGGGGGGGGEITSGEITSSLSGSGIDGPMAGANVSLYAMSVDAGTGDIAISGAPASTGTTDNQGNLQGITKPTAADAPYMMKIEAVDGVTVDLNTCTDLANISISTCSAPVVSMVKTVITADMIDTGTSTYATPLTTMVTELAIKLANADASLTIDGFVNVHLVKAGKDVASTFGFGLDSGIDILTTPPIVDSSTDTAEEQAATAEYRAAIAATVALLEQMSAQTADDSVDNLIVDLMDDLSDGDINGTGSAEGNYTVEDLQILEQDPAGLMVPGTTYTVSEVADLLIAEQAATGNTTDTTTTDLVSIVVNPDPAETNPDIDGDLVPNTYDAFPENPTEQSDNDADGIGDNADPDDDNDGYSDGEDAFATDASEWLDTDGDGVGNNTDTDDDGDGTDDTADACPLTAAATCADDPDGDNVTTSGGDNCPSIYNPLQFNTDTLPDGGDACDSDDDEDGTPDVSDTFPLNASEDTDTDGDGVGNNSDTDDDNDGIEDDAETNTGVFSAETDPVTNPLLTDTDGDGWFDNVDEAPTDNTSWYNMPPVARDDASTTDEDALISIDLAANDTDAEDDVTGTLATLGTFNLPANTDGGLSISNVSGNIQITPTADWSGSDSFSYTVTDSGGKTSDTATVTLTVNALNDAPVANDGTVSTNEDTPVSGSVSGSDIDSAIQSYGIVTNGSQGAAVITDAATGAFTYTPNADTSGTDTFTFVANDGLLDSAAGTVTVTITPVNDAPVANDGTVSTNEDTPVSGSVSGSDIDSAIQSYSIVTNGSQGAAVITDAATGAFTYTPNADANGSDSFTFVANDGSLDSVAGTVSVTINAVNDAPVATDSAVTTDEDTAVNGSVSGTDIDSTIQSYGIVTNGSQGTAIFDAATGAFTYTPNADASGTDSFTFVANDGLLDSAAGTVTVTITPVNDAPVANDGTVSTNEDTPVSGSVSGSDIDSTIQSYSIVTNGGQGTAVITDAATGAFTYTPNADASGTDTFTFVANDGLLDSAAGTVTVTITPVNDAPVANDGTATTDEDTPVSGSVSGSDIDSTIQSYSIVTNGSQGTAVITDAATGAFTYTPNADANGSDSFTFVANDGSLDSIAGTVSVTINAVNDAPVANDGTATTDEDTPVSGSVSGSDIDSTIQSYSIATNGSQGSAVITDAATGSFTYTPNADANGSDSFTFVANDGALDSAAATVTVTINPANDAPVAYDDAASANIDATPAVISVLANDTDVDAGDSMSVVSVTQGTLGSVVNNTSSVTYTNATGIEGQIDTFTYTMQDGSGAQSTATVTVTLTANAAPTFTSTAVTAATEDSAYSYAVTTADAESDAVTITDTPSLPGWLTLTDNGDGTASLDGIPANANVGDNAVVLRVTDTASGFTEQSFTIVVSNTNDAPAFDSTAVLSVDQGASYTYNVVTSDVDTGDTLAISATTQPLWLTTLIDNGDGTASLAGIPGNDDVGDHSVVLSVSDGTVSVEQSFTVTVSNINDDPVAAGDAADATLGGDTVINVLANDSDVDGDSLSITGVTNGALGTVAHNGSTVTYTNTSGVETDTDSFTYTVSDGNGGTAIGTVTVTLTSGLVFTPVDADVAMADGIASLNHETFGDTNYPSLVGDYYNYWTASMSTDSASFHWDGTSFISSPVDRNTVKLGIAGWASVPQGIANPLPVSADATAVNVQSRDASGNVLGDFTLSTFGEIDLAGMPMEQINIGNDAWIAAVTGNNFSAGAKLYQLTLTRNQSEYELWCGNAWSDAYGVNGCEVAFDSSFQPLTSLDGLIDVQMYLSDSYNNGAVSCPGSASATLRGSIASGSGSVDIYCDSDLSTIVATQIWTVDNVYGLVDVVVIPGYNDDGVDRIYTVYDGYVRPGDHMPAGVAGTFPIYGKAAADQMAAAFTPTATSTSSPIVGAWTFNADGSMGTDVLVFHENGQYVVWNDTSVTGATGCGGSTLETEIGTYSINEAAGEFTILSHLQNGAGGFDDVSDPCAIPPAPLSFSVIDQDTVTINDYGVTVYRVIDSTSPIVGEWSPGFDWGTTTASFTVFYKTGEFFNWCSQTSSDPTTDCTENNPSGIEGVEVGTYEWGVSATDMLDILSYSRDDNPSFMGLSSIVDYVVSTYGVSSIQTTVNDDCMEMPDVPIGTLYRAVEGASCGTTAATFSGIAADAAAILLAGVNQLDMYWNGILSQDVLSYTMLSGDASVTTDEQYVWDGSVFALTAYGTDRVLNPSTGLQEDFSDGKLITAVSPTEATIVNIDGSQYGDYTLTFEAMDISGVEMAGVLSPEWQAALTNSTAQFTAGNWLQATFTVNSDIYWVGMYDTSANCDVTIDATDNCDVSLYTIDGGVSWNEATSLTDFTSGAIVQVGWENEQIALMMNFDGVGGTTFYTPDGTPVGTGTYTDKVFGTTSVREFDVPADLTQYTEGDGIKIFFEDNDVTMGNVVRDGSRSMPGATGQFMALDDQALSELLPNIDASTGGGSGSVSGTVTNLSGQTGNILVALLTDPVDPLSVVSGTETMADPATGAYFMDITGLGDGTYYPTAFVDVNGDSAFDQLTEAVGQITVNITGGAPDIVPADITIN